MRRELPNWKVYGPNGEFEASTKRPETAAAIVALLGDGSIIKWRHKLVVWREGLEDQAAADSYDFVAITCHRRWGEFWAEVNKRIERRIEAEQRNAAHLNMIERGFK